MLRLTLNKHIVFMIFQIRSQTKKYHRCRYNHEKYPNNYQILPSEIDRILKPVANEETNEHTNIKTYRPEIG